MQSQAMKSQNAAMFDQLITLQRLVALGIGLIFLLIGIAGFVPGFTAIPAVASEHPLPVADLASSYGYGNLFRIFPTNYLHNAIHIVVGTLGIASATSLGGALTFNRGFALTYALIAFMGLLPLTNTFFGLMPILGNNIWLNAITAVIAGYTGFVKAAPMQAVLGEMKVNA
jgi:Domain of unknown function (DUF4383)